MLSNEQCPCQSGKTYKDCCQPFHLFQVFPETAEELMRSRYVAYTKVNIPYIVATTVPAQQSSLDQRAMKQWGETTKWLGLEIQEHHKNLTNIHSTVRFKALFQTEYGIESHDELSLFVRINQRWYFVDPTVPKPSQKHPCFCGSGKKFKHCCGII